MSDEAHSSSLISTISTTLASSRTPPTSSTNLFKSPEPCDSNIRPSAMSSIFLSRFQCQVQLLSAPTSDSPTLQSSLCVILFSSWLNLLLVFIPITWICHFVKPEEHTLIFSFSFLAIVAAARTLSENQKCRPRGRREVDGGGCSKAYEEGEGVGKTHTVGQSTWGCPTARQRNYKPGGAHTGAGSDYSVAPFQE
jgi:hypothetical protein